MSKKNFQNPYFQHDRYARQDPKIKSMLVHFRKISEEKAKAAVCLFWWIVEDMHAEDFKISDLEVYADDYRCDPDFLRSILEDFGLFRKEGDCYVSDRVLRNLKEQHDKSEKAKRSARKRWGKNTPQTPTEPPAEIDEELVNSIIDIFNKEFNKTQIISKENRERIFKITKDNNLNLEIWQRVFHNAKRGWDINGEIKQPSLKNILDGWDLFASDDYYLAPDYESIEEEKQQKLNAANAVKEEETKQVIYDYNEYLKSKEAICDAQSAIEHLNKFMKIPDTFLNNSTVAPDLMKKYNFTINDMLLARNKGKAV